MLFHRDKEIITYDRVVTALLTDNMQHKLLVSMHVSYNQSTSSSIVLTISRGRTSTKEKENAKTKIKSRSMSNSRDDKNIKCFK